MTRVVTGDGDVCFGQEELPQPLPSSAMFYISFLGTDCGATQDGAYGRKELLNVPTQPCVGSGALHRQVRNRKSISMAP